MRINFVLEYFKSYLRVINLFFASPFEWSSKTGLLISTTSKLRVLLYGIQKCGMRFYSIVIVRNTYHFLNSETIDLQYKFFTMTICTGYLMGTVVSVDFLSNSATIKEFLNGLIIFEREHLLRKFQLRLDYEG